VLVSLDEQVARLQAALAAKTDPDFLIIARSDGDVVSYEELVLRSNRYLQAGADVAMPICFLLDGKPVAQMSPDDQMELYARLVRDIDGPVKGVMIPQGYTLADMAKIGYRIVGLSAVCIEAAANALFEALTDLKEHGSNAKYRAAHPPVMSAPGGVMELMHLAEFIEFERQFAKKT
jgi:2-methylisocitrate lyase-like PEP mutase family enzyme